LLQGDEGDIASHFEEAEREAAIARLRVANNTEEPDEDEHGRYCLDCGDTIPPARVEAVHAVRCVECAGRREKAKRNVAGSDIRRYLME